MQSLERIALKDYTEKAYLDYSMYVILDRALAHIADGLKPVQRRIIYAMSELGLKSTAKFKKSARTVGDVLGKYHPHGDMACYDAMVLMAQPFSYRYPLIEGQGNFGSSDDPKSFAAMRYTESRLSTYAELLLSELEQGTVDWVPNFDGTLKEPALLAARVPNVLLNGTTGIAVGMATDIPAHNLREVGAALIALLDDAHISLEAIHALIPGPDLPTEAEIITPKSELLSMYRTGSGSFRMRAVFAMEADNIVITALPHQVSGAKILEQIAGQMQAKKLPLVSDIRDESDHENPTRLVIVPRSNRVDIALLMDHLFATTELERSYRVNLNMIGINGRPQVKNLLEVLQEWLEFRMTTVRRRLSHRLDLVNQRLHILAGLLIAYVHLDAIIAMIREADEPKHELIKTFHLSAEQAEAILEIKLRQLAKLEEIAIQRERETLQKEGKEIETILDSKMRLKKLIRSELEADVKKYGNARRAPLVERKEARAWVETEILPTEPMTVILSNKGWVRAAKGHDINPLSLSYKTGDSFQSSAQGRSNQQAVFMDSTGRTYSLAAQSLPSARGQGEPLTGKLKVATGAQFVGVLIGDETQLCVLASDAGFGFVTSLATLYSKNRSGKSVLRLPPNAQSLTPRLVEDVDQQWIAVLSSAGHLLIFPLKELPALQKGKGNKMIGIPSARANSREETVLDMALLLPHQTLILQGEEKSSSMPPDEWQKFCGKRGLRGLTLPRNIRTLRGLQVE